MYVSSPVIHETTVLTGGIDGVVYALDLTNGTELIPATGYIPLTTEQYAEEMNLLMQIVGGAH